MPPAAPAAPSDPGAENVLSGFATRLADTPGELADFGARFNRAVKQRDWDREKGRLMRHKVSSGPKD